MKWRGSSRSCTAAVSRIAQVWGTPEQERVAAEVWSGLAESTIDQGVLEHAQRIAVVPARFGWSDVGDWNNLGELIDARFRRQ